MNTGTDAAVFRCVYRCSTSDNFLSHLSAKSCQNMLHLLRLTLYCNFCRVLVSAIAPSRTIVFEICQKLQFEAAFYQSSALYSMGAILGRSDISP